MKQYTLNLNSSTRPIERYWEHSVGSCHAATALRQDWRDQLAQCHRELGFRYVRFHGLFNDDMSVVRRSLLGGELVLSFTNVDSIFDFLLSIGMKPFIELGFMPEALASGPDTIFHYKGNVTPPRSAEEWSWFIQQFVRHLIERYGRDEVRQWFFEVWNEPNLGGNASIPGSRFWAGSMEDYYELYRITALAVKAVDTTLPVGGPATSNNAHISDMLAYCRENGVPIDFVSTHHYPTDVVLGYGVEDSQNFITRFIETDKNDRDAVQNLAKEYTVFRRDTWKKVPRGVLTDMTKRAVQEADGLPVYYTEWSSLAGLPSDGPFGASFIAKTILDGMGLVKGYSYWTFSDIFEESGMPSVAFGGGFGLMTLHGIPKAPYNAFRLLHGLGSEQYAYAYSDGTIDVYALRKPEAGAVQLLLVNHNSLLHDIGEETVCVRLEGIHTEGMLEADIQRVDDEHANALAAWEAMGSPEYLTAGQVHGLKGAAELRREPLQLDVHNGSAVLEIALPAMGTALLTVYLKEGVEAL